MELPNREICYRALESRDARFDGLIYVGVQSTGIYCRPVCPARTPHFSNCLFFASAAAAQDAGFRPCLRCRPESAPHLASWHGTSNTVSRALAMIEEGALDGDAASVEKLADRLGVGERHLRRLFLQHLGASPVSVAQTRRVLFAKQLIHETRMPMAAIALAAGFGSVRRFNETFQTLFHRPPRALRNKDAVTMENGVTLRLRYRPPYDWDSILSFLQARAIPGVEVVENGHYLRTIALNGFTGTIDVFHQPKRESLSAQIRFPNVQSLPAIIARIRRQFDLGADIETINNHLSKDPLLSPFVAQHPGLRAPGGWDGFESAIRAILGQQISVIAARRLARQLVAAYGKPLPKTQTWHPGMTRLFPTASQLASAESITLGMPSARLAALRSLAMAAVADPNVFCATDNIDTTINRLKAIRGIGEWTAQYIALRAAREMDAFPATDAGLRRGTAIANGEKTTSKSLLDRAEKWRPWRAYAAQHLWAADAKTAHSLHSTGRSPDFLKSMYSPTAAQEGTVYESRL